MFEAQVAYYLNKYLGQYLQGLDADSLRISVWRGDVELRNLSLRPEALQELDLPVIAKAGLLGRLTLKVPWTALGREPVVVEFDRLYILACPKEQPVAHGPDVDVAKYEANVAASELEAKRKRVLEAETQWLQELQTKIALKAAQQLQQRQQQAGPTQKGGGGGGLFNINFQALIHTILGNLQLRLTNVHIRYEDSTSLPGQLLSGGILLGRVSAHTVDEAGKEAFVTTDVLNLLRKAVVLQDLGVYFDVGSPFLEPPRDWSTLMAREWDELFSPARHAPGSEQYRHHFLLLPITGQMNYVRRSSKFLLEHSSIDEGSRRPPRQEGRIALHALSLALSREQYVGSRALLEALDDYTANTPYRAMRPSFRPGPGPAARVWWRYGFLAVRKQLRLQAGGCSWTQLQTACRLRKVYVPTYAKCLMAAEAARAATAAKGGGSGAQMEFAGLGGDAAIAAMDAQLPEGTILLFRRMAHAMTQSQRPRTGVGGDVASEAAAPQALPQAGSVSSSRGGGGWVGWLMGTGSRRPASAAPSDTTAVAAVGAAPVAASVDGAAARVSATLSPEEWDRLQQLLHQEDDDDDNEEAAAPDGEGADPYGITALLEVAVEKCSLELGGSAAEGAMPLISSSMQAVGMRLVRYPATLAVSLRVGWAGLDTPQGMLLCTGQLGAPRAAHGGRSSSQTALETAGAAAGGQEVKSEGSVAGLRAVAGSTALPVYGSAAEEGAAFQPSCAFMLDFVRRPQDGSADATLAVRLAPSYVTYNPTVLTALGTFFSSDQQIGLGNLQAQAAARVQRLQRLAQVRLRALSKERPKLVVQVVMHAPKVALPDKKGRATLLLDLGCFSLSSSTPQSQGLVAGSNEAALYECFDMGLDRVEAALVGGPFAWPTTRPPLPPALEEVLGEASAAVAAPEGAAAADVAAATFALLGPLPFSGVGGVSPARSNGGVQGGSGPRKSSPLGLAYVARLAMEETAAEAVDAADGMPEAPAAESAEAAAGKASRLCHEDHDEEGRGGLADIVRHLAESGQLATPTTPAEPSESAAVPAPARPVVVTLLPRFGMQAGLQVAAAQDPRLPAVRLRVAASPLRVEFSPWRFHRLMAVLGSLTASSGGAAAASAAAASPAATVLPLWVTDAEYVVPVQLLSWEGVGGRVARWQPRSLSVWRGRVFLSREKGESEALETRSYWRGWRLLELPPEEVGGAENAVALVPEGVKREAAAECPEALVLRLSDLREVLALRRSLNRSAALVESVAGLLGDEEDGEPPSATSHGASGGSGSDVSGDPGGAGAGLGVTRDLLDELLAHRDLFDMSGSLPSLELRLSGRPPRAWRAVRQLAAAEPPPPPGAAELRVATRTAEVSDSVYQQSHAGTDIEGTSHGPGGSVSSFGDVPAVSASVTSSATGTRPPGKPESVGGGGDGSGGGGGGSVKAADELPPALLPSGGSGAGPASVPDSRVPGASDEGSEAQYADAADYDHDDDDDDDFGGTGSAYGGDEGTDDDADGQRRLGELTLEQEVPLLAVTLSAADVQVQYSADRLGVAAQMHDLRIDNELMGSALGSAYSVLAVSSAPSVAAAAGPAPQSGTAVAPAGQEAEGSRAAAVPGAASGGREAGAPLVQLAFTSNSSSSDRYKGLDTEISLQLAALSLMCHRPTVAALMGLGADMAYATNLLAAERAASAAAPPTASETTAAAASEPTQQMNDSPVTAATMAAAAAAAVPQPGDTAVVRSGGEGRTLLRLRMSMSRLQLVMPYEVLLPAPLPGAASPPATMRTSQHLEQEKNQQDGGMPRDGGVSPGPRVLALAEMDSFSFCLDVRPSSLELKTSLGNFTAQYGALPTSSPYRTICTLRPGTNGSLIEVAFRMHSAADSLSQPRVPRGQPFYSLSASLSAVQVVYLGRFLNELLPYLTDMLAMQPCSRPPIAAPQPPTPAPRSSASPAAPASTTAPAAASSRAAPPGSGRASAAPSTQPPTAPASSAMVLLLDVSLASPVITLPLNSASNKHVQLDLGTLKLANAVAWRRGAAAAPPPAAQSLSSAAGASAASGAPTTPPPVAGVDIAGPGAEGWQVLMDEMQVRLTDMSLVVGCTEDPQSSRLKVSTTGQNIIRDVGSGVLVALHRSLAIQPTEEQPPAPAASAPPPPPLPPLHAAVTLPHLSAVISEVEYRQLLAVLSGNFSEPAQNDPRTVELHQVLQRQVGSQSAPPVNPAKAYAHPEPAEATARAGSVTGPAPSPRSASAATAPRSPVLDFSRSLRSVLAALGDTCTIQATVAIGAARLTLMATSSDGGAALTPLTAVCLRDFWLGYYGTARGGMFLSATLPTFTIEDMRAGVSPEQRLVLSTGCGSAGGGAAAAATAIDRTGSVDLDVAAPTAGGPPGPAAQPSPSLLALEYRSVPSLGAAGASAGGVVAAVASPAASALRLRLQRPTLVLDFGLLLRLVNFVSPYPVLQGASLRPFETRDVHVPYNTTYLARGEDLWLSPEVRLVADAPAGGYAGSGLGLRHVYDGGGGRLVLPPGLAPAESLPLIVVGAGRTLQLKNVRVVNSASLRACLSLGAGAKFLAVDDDGVKMLRVDPEVEQKYAAVIKGAAEAAAAAAPSASAADASPGTDAAGLPPVFEMSVDALGTSLHIIEAHLDPDAAGGPGGGGDVDGPPSRSAFGSAADLTLALGGGAQGAAATTARPPRSGGDAPVAQATLRRGVDAETAAALVDAMAQRLQRRLVLQLDASASYRSQGDKQEAAVALRGLTMRTVTIFPSAGPTAVTAAATPLTGGSPPLSKAASSANLPATPSFRAGGGAGLTSAAVGAVAAGPSTTITTTLLEPSDIAARYNLNPSNQDVSLDLGSLTLRLSPAALHLLLQLHDMVLKPLMAPSPNQPLTRCDRFKRMWSSQWATRQGGATSGGGDSGGGRRGLELGVGGVDSLADERGVTVWRPQPADGYVALGDVLTAGSHMPSRQVGTLAINSGLVAFPLAYECVWTGPDTEDLALWRPLPPAGYVAMGCVAGSRSAPPPLGLVGCVAGRAVVESWLGECLLLAERGNLWAVQNVGATFEVSPPEAHLPAVPLYDLRIPMGVPPAALTPLPELLPTASAVVPLGLVREASLPVGDASTPLPLSLLCQWRYLRSRSAQIHRAVSQANQLICVEFLKIWWDKQAPSPTANRLSIWRPKTPPGYVFLGDCVSTGIYAPPPSIVVLRDSDPAALLTDPRPPKLARPINYIKVWYDEQRERAGEKSYLVLWKPVPPAGYVPLGLVAGLGPKAPSPGLPVRCVLSKLVTTETLPRASPEWVLPAYKQRAALCGWTTDRRTGTFTILSGPSAWADTSGAGGGEGSFSGGSRQGGATFEALRIKLDADDPSATPEGAVFDSSVAAPDSGSAEATDGGGTPRGGGGGTSGGSAVPFRRTDVIVRMSRAVVLLRSSLGRPLLELDVRDTTFCYQNYDPDLSRSYTLLNVSIWTHNTSLGVWEPLLEPWQLLAHLDDNRAAKPIGGVGPGTSMKITSTQASVQVVLSASALKAVLEALPEWTGLTSPEGLAAVRRQLAYGEAAAGGSSYGSQVAQQGLMTNALGSPVSLLTDLGDRQAVVELQTDAEDVPVLLQPPPTGSSAAESRAAGLAPPPVPPIRMFVDAVSAAGLPEELLREGGLMVRIKVNGPVAELMPESTWGLFTRAVDPAHQQEDEKPAVPDTPAAGGAAGTAQGRDAEATATVVRWDERFLLKLPVALSEELLCPAPGDNQFDGVPLQLDVALLACGAAGGPPRVVAAGTLPLQSDWLANEVDILRNTAAAAAAAAAASGTLSSLGTGLDGAVRSSGATAAAAPAPSAVSEAMDVKLFPARVVSAGDGSGRAWGRGGHAGRAEGAAAAADTSADEPPMLLQLRLSLDVHQVDSSWQPFLSRTRRRVPTAGTAAGGPSAASVALSGGDGRYGAVAAAAAVRGGRRALKLYGSDTWVPFGRTGGIITSGPGGDVLQASSCIPIRAGPGLVLERSPGPGGQPLELLRSLAVLVNITGVPLEVSLVAGDPEMASWTLLAGAAKPPEPGGKDPAGGAQGREATAAPPAPVEEDVYENERFIPLLGWSANNLLPTERRRYSRHGLSCSSFPLVPLAPGWEWEGPWYVETAGNVDINGWFYALDWPLLRYPPTPEQARRKVTDMVRRRRWLRRRRWVGVGAKSGTGGARGGPPRRLLGVVVPGDRLPLPLGWEVEGMELQVRPMATEGDGTGVPQQGSPQQDGAEPEPQVSHEWSGGLVMSSLDEGGARLLSCKPMAQAAPSAATGPLGAGAKGSGTDMPKGSSTSAFAEMALVPGDTDDASGSQRAVDPKEPAWLSVSLEYEALVATSGGLMGPGMGLDTLVDWRLVVRPPLTLHNTLPVAGRYSVWERSSMDNMIRMRQQGRVAAGAAVPVFSADMRMQVYLEFAPDGCEFGEPDPVIISDGFMRNAAGVAVAPRLPDGFRCTYSNSRSFYPLRINVNREIDTSAASGVLATGMRRAGVAGGVMSPGEAVAQGYPMTVSLHVPLWLVNATQLPIFCGVLAMEPPPGAATEGGGGGAGAGGPGAVQRSEPSMASGGSFSSLSIGGPQPPPYLLKIIDTEAFRNSPRPNAYVAVGARSLELLSYPPGYAYEGDGGHGGFQVALVLSLYGSRWTQPIYLPRPGEPMQPRPGASGVPLPADRLLIRALCQDGCIHEVAVRLESAPLGLGGTLAAGIGMAATRGSVAVLVRLEHHVLLTNTTGYPLTLLQPDAAASAGSGIRGGLAPGATGLSFTAGSSSGQLLRNSVAQGGNVGSSSSRKDTLGTGAALSAALTTSLLPGSLGMPLHWAAPAAPRRQLCLSLPLAGEAASSAAAYGLPASCMWSEPLKIDMPGGQDAQVPLPVYCLGPVGRYHAAHQSSPVAGALGAMAALSNMTPQQRRVYELQRAYQIARQLFASLGGGSSGSGGGEDGGGSGVGPKAHKLETLGSLSSVGSGPAADGSGTPAAASGPSASGGAGRKAGAGSITFGPGWGPGLMMLSQGSGGDASGDPQHPPGASPRRSGPPPLCLQPSLVRLVRPTELGNVEFLAVLLNVRLVMRSPGCLVLQLTSMGGEPQQLLHNATPLQLMWRQASPRAAWARVEPYSAVAVCRGVLGEGWGAPPEVELRDTEPQSESSLLLTTDLMAAARAGGGLGSGFPGRAASGLSGGPLGAAAGDPGRPVLQGVFRVGQLQPNLAPREVMAQVCSADDLVLTPDGLAPLPGAVTTGLGASRLDTVMRLALVPPPLPPSGPGSSPSARGPPSTALLGPYLTPGVLSDGRVDGGPGGRGGVSSSTHMTVSIGSLELSLVDGRPEEIALLTVEEMTAELITGRAAGVDFTHLSLRLRSVQLDDQTPGSAYPVVLQPLEQSGAGAPGANDPLFVLLYCCQPGKLRYALHCPVIASRLLPLRFSLAEPLLWRLYGMAQSVMDAGAAGKAPPAQRRQQQQQQVSGSDVPLDIELMVVEDLALRLSFRAEAGSRPRWASVGAIKLGLDLAQLEDLALDLPGIELERQRLPRSDLLKKVYDKLRERIFSMAVKVLYSAGVMGGLSKVLAVSSAGVAQLASDGRPAQGRTTADSAGAGGAGGGEVRSLQGGVMEGGRMIAKGVLAGAAGIITKPLEGAEKGGVSGFFGGLVKGVVGAAVQPVSGALAAVSKVTEGVDATRRNIQGAVAGVTGRKPGVGRKRLQRAFTGDNVLRPFSLHPALGQALLYSVATWLGPSAGGSNPNDPRAGSASGGSLLSLGSSLSFVGALPSRSATSSRPDLRRDRYEEHWVLPGCIVLLITDRRVLAMRAPEFVALQASVLSGDVTHVTEVPVGDAMVLWHLPWPEMLSAELAWYNKGDMQQQQQQRQPARSGLSRPSGGGAAAASAATGGFNSAAPADGLLLHRKFRSEDGALYYEVHCVSGTSQAADILNRLQEVRYRCYLLLRQQERGWRDSQPQQMQLAAAANMAAAAASTSSATTLRGGSLTVGPSALSATAGGPPARQPHGGADIVLPDTMLSQDYRLVWAATGSRASGGRSSSIWRPVGPPGYVALGDVAVAGREPPRPVRLYKDSPALAAAAVNASGSGDAPASEIPRLAPPLGYTLIFRDSAAPPLTVWKPVPPRGYAELGCVAWPEIEEPPLGLVRCLRRDLVAPGHIFDAPVWAGGSSDNQYWRCGLWQVDCAAGTFVAVKGDGKPPPYLVRQAVF